MPRLNLAIGFILCLSACSAVAQAPDGPPPPPWPADVPGHVAPLPSEHPRLLFRRADVPKLRARAQTPEGRALIKRLKQQLGGDENNITRVRSSMQSALGRDGGPKPARIELPEGAYTFSHAAGYGLLYQLTGDRRWARLGAECFELAFNGQRDRDREGLYAWKAPGGALRAGPTLGWYAVGYDLCYDGWDLETRRKIAQAIQDYNEGPYLSLAELVAGGRTPPGSHHYGMQVGGATLAVLAIMNDPGVDMAKLQPLLDQSVQSMRHAVTDGFGSGGHFAEGDAAGAMASHMVYLPAVQAWHNAGGKDFVTPRPNVGWTALKWLLLSVPDAQGVSYPARGAYPDRVWARNTLDGAGYLNTGVGVVPEAQRGAFRWFYQQHFAEADAEAGTPFGTASPYPHHTVLAFINHPFDAKPVNPAAVMPKVTRDKRFQFYGFRNRWQDANDIVISQLVRTSKGTMQAPADPAMRIRAFGEDLTWGSIPQNPNRFDTDEDGSTVIGARDGSWMIVDLSGKSGADVMLVMVGRDLKLEADQKLQQGRTTYAFRYLTQGEPPVAEWDERRIVVGEQVIEWVGKKKNRRLALGSMPEPEKPTPPPSRTEPAEPEPPQVVVDPAEEKRAQGRLRNAKTYLRVDKKDDAKRILTEILAEWPNTEAAKEAKSILYDPEVYEQPELDDLP